MNNAQKPRQAQMKELQLSHDDLLELLLEAFKQNQPFRFRADGWSMAPFIKPGDVITLVTAAVMPPASGRVAAFRNPQSGLLQVHRVVSCRKSACLMKGDNITGRNDGWVLYADLLGWVVRIERNSKPVKFGLGAERTLLAWLSRLDLLTPLVSAAHWMKQVWRRSKTPDDGNPAV